MKPCLRSCSRLSIPNNTFPPSSFDSLQGTKWRVFRHDFPTVNTHPSSLLIPFHKFSRLLRARGGTMRRVEHARAENGKRPIMRRRTIGGGNSPAVSRNYGILAIAPSSFSFPSLFFLLLFLFFERKRVWKIRRRCFFYLFRKGRRDKENY